MDHFDPGVSRQTRYNHAVFSKPVRNVRNKTEKIRFALVQVIFHCTEVLPACFPA